MSKFIQALFAFVSAMWMKGKKFIDQYAETAVEFVNRLKTIVDNPSEAAIAALIPGIKDDKALAWLRENLLKILFALDIPVPIEDQTDIVKVMRALLLHIASKPKSARPGLYRDLAALLAQAYAENDKFKHLKSMTRERIDLAVAMQVMKLNDKDDPEEDINA